MPLPSHVEEAAQQWPAHGALDRLKRLERLDRMDRRDRQEQRERQDAAFSAHTEAAALHAQGEPDRKVAAGASLLGELVAMGQDHLIESWQPGIDEEAK